MKQLIAPVLFVALLAAADVRAQDTWMSGWLSGGGNTTAFLAISGFEQLSAAGLSWPDGRQGIVTFWKGEASGVTAHFRCVTYFDASMVEAGELCRSVFETDQ
jgi:hypothetical protein